MSVTRTRWAHYADKMGHAVRVELTQIAVPDASTPFPGDPTPVVINTRAIIGRQEVAPGDRPGATVTRDTVKVLDDATVFGSSTDALRAFDRASEGTRLTVYYHPERSPGDSAAVDKPTATERPVVERIGLSREPTGGYFVHTWGLGA